jgi:hypothetical protein
VAPSEFGVVEPGNVVDASASVAVVAGSSDEALVEGDETLVAETAEVVVTESSKEDAGEVVDDATVELPAGAVVELAEVEVTGTVVAALEGGAVVAEVDGTAVDVDDACDVVGVVDVTVVPVVELSAVVSVEAVDEDSEPGTVCTGVLVEVAGAIAGAAVVDADRRAIFSAR